MRLYLSALLVAVIFAASQLWAKDPKYDIKEVTAAVAEQQASDPVIGVWSGGAGGYNWQIAVIRNPVSDGYEFAGVMLKPWPGFKSGELILRLNKSRSAGVYEGTQKWKAGWSASWQQARFALNGNSRAVQYNNVSFQTPIGTDWNLFKEEIASPLKKTQGTQSIALASVSTEGRFDANVFVWFDEPSLVEGTPVIEVTATKTAYDSVLELLRQQRGQDPSLACTSCTNILATDYHPEAVPLATWLKSQPSAERISSLFYWENEHLDDSTPVMNFYMTKRAYAGTMEAVQQYLTRQMQQAFGNAPPPESRTKRFLSALAIVAQGALSGMANYYATVKPIEDARRASMAQTNALSNIGYELQRLNMQIDARNTQLFVQQMQQQGDQYSRALYRYNSGHW